MIGRLVVGVTKEEAEALTAEDLPDVITPGREAQNRVGNLVLAVTAKEAAELEKGQRVDDAKIAALASEQLSTAEIERRLEENPLAVRELFAAELQRPDRRRTAFRLMLRTLRKQEHPDAALLQSVEAAFEESQVAAA